MPKKRAKKQPESLSDEDKRLEAAGLKPVGTKIKFSVQAGKVAEGLVVDCVEGRYRVYCDADKYHYVCDELVEHN